MEKRENFGRYIKEKRKAAGLSQKELATQLFVSESAVSKWERGLSVPDISLLVPLAEQLNVTVAELLQGCRVEEEQRFTREETEELIRKALTFSAEPPERRQARTQKFLPLYGVSVVLGLVETAAVWAVGAGRERGRNDAADYKRDLRHRIWGLHLVLDAGNIAALL